MDWTLPHFSRKRGRPRVSWTSTAKKDLDLLGLTWDEALDLTRDRSEWRDDLPDVLFQHEEGLRSKVR